MYLQAISFSIDGFLPYCKQHFLIKNLIFMLTIPRRNISVYVFQQTENYMYKQNEIVRKIIVLNFSPIGKIIHTKH